MPTAPGSRSYQLDRKALYLQRLPVKFYYLGAQVAYFDTMQEVSTLIGALKSALRQRGYTYADIARELALSESSIKRLFSNGKLSLKRLQKICDWAGIEWDELAALMETRDAVLEQLSIEQEQALTRDIKLLLVAFLLLNHWAFEQILTYHDIDELEGTRLLAKLDRLKIIDLLPGNKVRMRLSRNFNWRPNGPIQSFFEKHVQTEFFQARFDETGELRLFLTGMLSDASSQILQQRLRRVAAEFEMMVREDRRLEPGKRQGTTVILATRPWNLSLFKELRKVTRQS